VYRAEQQTKEHEMTDTTLIENASKTALVVIDLQKGIVGRELAPHSAQDVVARCATLADALRAAGGTVALVHVSFGADRNDALTTPVDQSFSSASFPPGWDELVPEMTPKEGDLVVTKRQWGAFYGTDLEMRLRRRHIDTIVIGGIATNFGVESTARDAWEHGFAVIFAEDAMSSMEASAHEFAVKNIFPRLGRVRSTADVLGALGQ
jgi:nicotinamidase-related amidase